MDDFAQPPGEDNNNDNSTANTPKPTPNGLRGFDVVRSFLEDDGWHPHRLGNRHVLHMQFSGKNGLQNCYMLVRTDLEQLLFYAVAPIKAPEEVRGAIAEFITRANYGLRIGNFEMDYSDGEIRYKSSLDFEDVQLQPPMVRATVYPAVQTLDRYMPGLMRVMFGGRTPVEAIYEVEQDYDEADK